MKLLSYVRTRWLFSLVLLIVLAISGLPAGASEELITWSFGPPSPFLGARFDGEFVPAQQRVYFLGFRDENDATNGSVWYLDVASGQYTDTGVDMPVPVSNYKIALLRDATGVGLYVFGGRDANAAIVTTVQAYYPATNTAVEITTDPWPGQTPAGCISLPAMGVTVASNRAIVTGGMSFAANGCADDQSAETWVFNPISPAGQRWTPGPALNVGRGYITTVAVGNRIYAIGGDTIDAGLLIPINGVEAWQVGGGGWNASVADLPIPCDESQAFSFAGGPLQGSVLLAGCGQWPNATADTFLYNASLNTWAPSTPLNEIRRNHAGAIVNTPSGMLIYVLGGYESVSGFFDPTPRSEVSPPEPLIGGLSAPAFGRAPERAMPTN